MHLEHYITELLYRYNCVVVPNFGAFLSNTLSARIDTKRQILTPPTKMLSFNQQLKNNDGLLVAHIASTKKLPYEALIQEVEETVKRWKEILEKEESLMLEGIGKLWLGQEQKVQFAPETSVNYLTASFGLAAFPITTISREKLKVETEELEERVPFLITPEKREKRGIRPYLKYAAVIFLAVAAGTSAYQLFIQRQEQQQLVMEAVQQQVSEHIQQATFFDDLPLELPVLQFEVAKREQYPKHHIIAGAFRVQQNADKKITQLTQAGYPAQYLGTNSYGLHQVAYATFSDKYKALDYLAMIKRTVSQDAWMLSERKP